MEQLRGLESLVLIKLYATDGTAANQAVTNRLENYSVLNNYSAFSSLKSLKLHGMRWGLREPTTYWDRSRDVDWPKCIASFLLNARHLEELHLSTLSLQCDNALEGACEEYAARCNDGHLVSLKNLSLATGMHTPSVKVLRKAFNLSALVTIRVCGCNFADAVPSVLELCAPTVTPNLQKITLDRIPPENFHIVPEITQGRTSFGSDPMCWGKRANVYELARLSRAPQLWLPRPRGFEDEFDYVGLLQSVANCDWLSHLALCVVVDERLVGVSLASEDDVNTNYSEDDAESDDSEWDTDYSSSHDDDAANLAQMEAALPALCEVLKTLSRLKIFCVQFLRPRYGRFTNEEFGFSLMTAKLVVKACPTLQYIAVQSEIFVATWPTLADGSTEEPEPCVQRMTRNTELAEVVKFVEEYDTYDFGQDSALMDAMFYCVP